MILARRSFLSGLANLIVAPAIVKADALMRVGNIDHILYPVRGLVAYNIGTDRLFVRIDRASFPMNMTPKSVQQILTEKEINLLFTKDQIAAILPTRPMQQLGIDKLFDSQEWLEKGLLTRTQR